MSDQLALANAIEGAGIERGKAELLAVTGAGTHLGGSRTTPAAVIQDLRCRSGWERAKNYGRAPHTSPLPVQREPYSSLGRHGVWQHRQYGRDEVSRNHQRRGT